MFFFFVLVPILESGSLQLPAVVLGMYYEDFAAAAACRLHTLKNVTW